MRSTALVIAAILFGSVQPIEASQQRSLDFATQQDVLRWVNGYRSRPEPVLVPAAFRALSHQGALRDPETSGTYAGFLAGVISANPAEAESLLVKTLPLPPEDQWVIIRAIAYSGIPDWKYLMQRFYVRMPSRSVMIEAYVQDKLPTLKDVAFEKVKDKEKEKEKPRLEASPEVLDTYWGYYLATGAYEPISRIIVMLPWSKDDNDVDRLMVGSMAKYALASNASREQDLLNMLKWAAPHQKEKPGVVLKEVIYAAETAQLAPIKKQAMASIEDLRRKGPSSKRNVGFWGTVGQSAIALGCVAAAAAGQVALGLPCVLGGATASAAMQIYAAGNQ